MLQCPLIGYWCIDLASFVNLKKNNFAHAYALAIYENGFLKRCTKNKSRFRTAVSFYKEYASWKFTLND